MDVRCERCQTEYELDDASVSDAGTPVQCTTCGYTFLVRRDAAEDTVEEPPPADWLLETSDGQMHRFRNLTSLQKWIIERKVTRQDKISRTGHAWRRLGEIVELAPFFDVVDDADRARATSAMAARDLVTEAEAARRVGQNAPAAPRGPASDTLSGRSPSPPARRATPLGGVDGRGHRPAEFEPFHPGGSGGFGSGGEVQTSVVRVGGGARMLKAVAGLVVAGGVAYVGITQPWKKAALIDAAQTVPTPDLEGAPVIAVAPPPAPPPPPAPTEVPQAASPAPADPAPVAAAAKQPLAGPAKAPAAKALAAKAPAAKELPAPGGKAYDRLVTDADRLLENGNSARAMKLFDQALALKPSGAEALAGMGYVNLDKGRSEIAIGYFRKALSSGMFAPAQFGLAEAQRAAGDKSGALESYKKYLEASPGGGDSSAARRQIKSLEAGGSAAKTEAAPSPNQPPATPSSVLSEPAKP